MENPISYSFPRNSSFFNNFGKQRKTNFLFHLYININIYIYKILYSKNKKN